MIGDTSAFVVDKTRRFVSVAVKSISNRLRLVYRHWVFGEASKQRNPIGKEEPQAIEIAQGAEGIRQIFYGGESGVGVYQGEVVILLKWVRDTPQQWVICTLSPSLVHPVQKDTVCELLQAAVILAHYLQCASGKSHSQNSAQTPLLHSCPHTRQHETDGLSLPKVHGNPVCPLPTLLAQLVPQLCRYSPESPKCPFEKIINLLNEEAQP